MKFLSAEPVEEIRIESPVLLLLEEIFSLLELLLSLIILLLLLRLLIKLLILLELLISLLPPLLLLVRSILTAEDDADNENKEDEEEIN